MSDDLDLFGVFEEDQSIPATSLHTRKSSARIESADHDGDSTTSSTIPAKRGRESDDTEKTSTLRNTASSGDTVNAATSRSAVDSNASKRSRKANSDENLLDNLKCETETTSGPLDKAVSHDVAKPDQENAPKTKGDVDESKTTALDDTLPEKMAKEYKFTLDPFQRRSIACLERNESVLVSAHTSAGKTVVAEYAIAMGLRDKQRVIYTSPIKALSNQKYRDLYDEFSDVGLMTGDVTINPNASCLVMTTEILRSMLYRGSEITREVKWVIYDEIHYMRDKERGVVWEESIIMLPPQVRFVFLSATIPNAKEFASWIAKIKHQSCHVVYTDYRPTPLQHFVFPSGGDGVYLVVDEKGRFREENFQKAMAQLQDGGIEGDAQDVIDGKSKGKKKGRKSGGKGKGPPDLFRLVKMVMERNYDPVIVFSFSKRECESYALQIGKLDFTNDDEKKLIDTVFTNAIDNLSEDDKQLPQVHAILPLLRRGVGIHHGGLLPILKEVIEILFSESLLKVLFATETFAMGINMPARTVIFTSCRKFDGSDFRLVSAGEYIQMSGRAGRRGLDDKGIVIQMIEEKMEPSTARQLMRGTADPLNSSFHLGYNMLLNLMRVEDADPERTMQLSFHQFQNEQAAPKMEADLAELQGEYDAIEIPKEKEVSSYYDMTERMTRYQAAMRTFINQPKFALPFLQPGRLVRIRDGDDDWGWGIVVNYQQRKGIEGSNSSLDDPSSVVVDTLLVCDPSTDTHDRKNNFNQKQRIKPRPCPPDVAAAGHGVLKVIPTLLSLFDGLSSVRMYLPQDLRSVAARRDVAAKLLEVKRRFKESIPLLDPVKDMHIEDKRFKTLISRISELQESITVSPFHTLTTEERERRYALYEHKQELKERLRVLKKAIRGTQVLAMKSTLRNMKSVLRRLGHADDDNVVQVKGRVACEINTADELLLTELIFNGVFNDLTPAQSAALLSCMVFAEKGSEDPPSLPEELSGPFQKLQEAARRVATVSKEYKLDIDVEEYVQSFRPDIMELVSAWVKGAKFADICQMTKVFEGTIVRVMRRLEELLRQLSDAARSIGDHTLKEKFSEASTQMRRDIIFAASLYL